MKHLSKMLVCAGLLLVGCIIFVFWFEVAPRRTFHLGMSRSEVEVAAGPGRCEIIPLPSAIHQPPTPYELTNVAFYKVRIPSRGVTMYLNFSNRVIYVEHLLGHAEGNLTRGDSDTFVIDSSNPITNSNETGNGR